MVACEAVVLTDQTVTGAGIPWLSDADRASYHEPPFYVCGSDQWVAGYMEGAVRTGRGAARAALAHG